MIFTRVNIEKIRAGRKTETRRIWKVPHVKVGAVYRTRPARTVPVDPADPRILVIAMRVEPLGAIASDEGAVLREGCESIGEFQAQWLELHGRWDPDRPVTVVQFEVVP